MVEMLISLPMLLILVPGNLSLGYSTFNPLLYLKIGDEDR